MMVPRLRSEGITNVEGVVNTPKDVPLPAGSVDIAFVSDVYHHFEYPQAMLRAIRAALKPGGTLVIVEFERIEGVSSSGSWNMCAWTRRTRSGKSRPRASS